nr:HEXXH motif-containing putative peptide modification protein [Streptomyces sp. CBMA152]
MLTDHAPIVCLLDGRGLDEPLHSWALTRLPGTVFTDYTGHPEILARDLIHEAAHNWLNDALTLHGIHLPDGVTFYSPWRGTRRPVYGFLHACWAFSLTILYSQAAVTTTDDPVKAFLNAYLHQQRTHLAAASLYLDKACHFLSHSALHDRLRDAVGRAQHALGVLSSA